MEAKKTIYCKLLGGIAFRSTPEEEWHSLESVNVRGMGKKHQAFLAYLLLNHHRRISSEELIQNFWPGDNKDPANSLKNTMHKMRNNSILELRCTFVAISMRSPFLMSL